MTAVVTMSDLLQAGVHFGHQKSRWNPKMHRYLWGERSGIYIIDLRQTLVLLEKAYAFVRDTTANGGTILFVGTKRQAQHPIERHAAACSMPYVNQRWLGGMLTNFRTIRGRVEKMLDYERMRKAGDFDNMPKKEALQYQRELDKLQRNLNGVRHMDRLPDAVFVLDTPKEHIAVAEAARLKLPIVAVADSNSDPDPVTYVIPGNDDAIRSTELLCRVIAEAVREGQFMAQRNADVAALSDVSPEEQARRDAAQESARRAAQAEALEREARIAAEQARKAAQAASVPDKAALSASLHPTQTPEAPQALSHEADAPPDAAETAHAQAEAESPQAESPQAGHSETAHSETAHSQTDQPDGAAPADDVPDAPAAPDPDPAAQPEAAASTPTADSADVSAPESDQGAS